MAWTTPKTWASEIIIDTHLNTYVRDNQNYLKGRVDGSAKQYVRTATNYTTTSTTFTEVDATNLSLTITTTGGDLRVTFAGFGNGDQSGRTLTLGVDVNGTEYEIISQRTANGNDNNLSFSYIFTGLAAGSHVFKLLYKIDAGTFTLTAGTLLFDVREDIGVVS